MDAANVVGSVPDGWWKDRAGAASRLLAALSGLAVPATELELGGDDWFPEVSVVVEGQANAVQDAAGLTLVRAPGAGDDAIVAEAARLVGLGRAVTVVTSDRGLQARVEGLGTGVRSSGWLRALL